MPHEYISQQQVAAKFGISDRTVRRMIADGRLPAHRVGPNARQSPQYAPLV